MFENSYHEDQTKNIMAFHQKILVVENYGSSVNYTPKMFNHDLKNLEYSVPIKYFSSRS